MSQLCRMTPKNCKINTQRLIRKLALEILSPYNTPESIGTTYRIYSDEAILERRREAGLEWVVRSRGVEFVDPAPVAVYCPSVHLRIRQSPTELPLKNIGIYRPKQPLTLSKQNLKGRAAALLQLCTFAS